LEIIRVNESTLSSAQAFAALQFSDADLGDARRSKRLVRVAAGIAQNPCGTLNGAIPDWADVQGAYRLLAGTRTTLESVTAPHRKKVYAACAAAWEVLLVEDTSTLNYSTLKTVKDMGWIGDDEACKGFNLHSTLALRVESWKSNQEPDLTMLGLFGIHCWTRTHSKRGPGAEKKFERLKRARESQRWAAVLGAREGPPKGVRWTFVADREADIYEVFQHCREAGMDWIVRANQPRALEEEDGSVFSAVAGAPRLGQYTLKLRARPDQKRRTAKLEVRAIPVTLRGPQRPGGRLEPETMNVVEVREVAPPEGVEPIHWVLLTSWPIGTFGAALRVIKSYAKRWVIEEYHKALKSGVGVEDSQLTSAQSLQALIGILAIVALRLLSLKLLNRGRPDEAVNPDAIGPEALLLLEKAYGKPEAGWTNGTLLSAIARLGGFKARKGDGSPGWKTIWKGWHKLMTMVEGVRLLMG
jgi:hypothetical protein